MANFSNLLFQPDRLGEVGGTPSVVRGHVSDELIDPSPQLEPVAVAIHHHMRVFSGTVKIWESPGRAGGLPK